MSSALDGCWLRIHCEVGPCVWSLIRTVFSDMPLSSDPLLRMLDSACQSWFFQVSFFSFLPDPPSQLDPVQHRSLWALGGGVVDSIPCSRVPQWGSEGSLLTSTPLNPSQSMDGDTARFFCFVVLFVPGPQALTAAAGLEEVEVLSSVILYGSLASSAIYGGNSLSYLLISSWLCAHRKIFWQYLHCSPVVQTLGCSASGWSGGSSQIPFVNCLKN